MVFERKNRNRYFSLGISEGPQQRGGIHANPWHRLLDSCEPSTMQGQVTEASRTQSGLGVKDGMSAERFPYAQAWIVPLPTHVLTQVTFCCHPFDHTEA